MDYMYVYVDPKDLVGRATFLQELQFIDLDNVETGITVADHGVVATGNMSWETDRYMASFSYDNVEHIIKICLRHGIEFHYERNESMYKMLTHKPSDNPTSMSELLAG